MFLARITGRYLLIRWNGAAACLHVPFLLFSHCLQQDLLQACK